MSVKILPWQGQSALETLTTRIASLTSLKDQTTSQLTRPFHTSRLSCATICASDGRNAGITVTLNLAEKEAVKEVLQALADGGYVVLKSATDLNKSTDKQDILSNKVGSVEALSK